MIPRFVVLSGVSLERRDSDANVHYGVEQYPIVIAVHHVTVIANGDTDYFSAQNRREPLQRTSLRMADGSIHYVAETIDQVLSIFQQAYTEREA